MRIETKRVRDAPRESMVPLSAPKKNRAKLRHLQHLLCVAVKLSLYNLLAPIIVPAGRRELHLLQVQHATATKGEPLSLAPVEINQNHVAEDGPSKAIIRHRSAAPVLRHRLT